MMFKVPSNPNHSMILSLLAGNYCISFHQYHVFSMLLHQFCLLLKLLTLRIKSWQIEGRL